METEIKTGRGHRAEDHHLVMDYLRRIHPKTARKMTIAKKCKLDQNRVLIILNNLSGVSEDKDKEDAEFIPKDFLIYQDDGGEFTRYGIWKDVQEGIYP